jgi:hypothetical protein
MRISWSVSSRTPFGRHWNSGSRARVWATVLGPPSTNSRSSRAQTWSFPPPNLLHGSSACAVSSSQTRPSACSSIGSAFDCQNGFGFLRPPASQCSANFFPNPLKCLDLTPVTAEVGLGRRGPPYHRCLLCYPSRCLLPPQPRRYRHLCRRHRPLLTPRSLLHPCHRPRPSRRCPRALQPLHAGRLHLPRRPPPSHRRPAPYAAGGPVLR